MSKHKYIQPIHPQLKFGVELEKLYPPWYLHPALKNLFYLIEISTKNKYGGRYSIEDILGKGPDGQGTVHERYSLKEHVIKGRDILELKVPPGVPMWLLRHFLGLLPTPIFPPEPDKHHWLNLSILCDDYFELLYTIDPETSYECTLNILKDVFAKELANLPERNITLLFELFELIRFLAKKRSLEDTVDKYKVLQLAHYIAPSLFVRPYRPGHVTNEEKKYFPMIQFITFYWPDILSQCHEYINKAKNSNLNTFYYQQTTYDESTQTYLTDKKTQTVTPLSNELCTNICGNCLKLDKNEVQDKSDNEILLNDNIQRYADTDKNITNKNTPKTISDSETEMIKINSNVRSSTPFDIYVNNTTTESSLPEINNKTKNKRHTHIFYDKNCNEDKTRRCASDKIIQTDTLSNHEMYINILGTYLKCKCNGLPDKISNAILFKDNSTQTCPSSDNNETDVLSIGEMYINIRGTNLKCNYCELPDEIRNALLAKDNSTQTCINDNTTTDTKDEEIKRKYKEFSSTSIKVKDYFDNSTQTCPSNDNITDKNKTTITNSKSKESRKKNQVALLPRLKVILEYSMDNSTQTSNDNKIDKIKSSSDIKGEEIREKYKAPLRFKIIEDYSKDNTTQTYSSNNNILNVNKATTTNGKSEEMKQEYNLPLLTSPSLEELKVIQEHSKDYGTQTYNSNINIINVNKTTATDTKAEEMKQEYKVPSSKPRDAILENLSEKYFKSSKNKDYPFLKSCSIQTDDVIENANTIDTTEIEKKIIATGGIQIIKQPNEVVKNSDACKKITILGNEILSDDSQVIIIGLKCCNHSYGRKKIFGKNIKLKKSNSRRGGFIINKTKSDSEELKSANNTSLDLIKGNENLVLSTPNYGWKIDSTIKDGSLIYDTFIGGYHDENNKSFDAVNKFESIVLESTSQSTTEIEKDSTSTLQKKVVKYGWSYDPQNSYELSSRKSLRKFTDISSDNYKICCDDLDKTESGNDTNVSVDKPEIKDDSSESIYFNARKSSVMSSFKKVASKLNMLTPKKKKKSASQENLVCNVKYDKLKKKANSI